MSETTLVKNTEPDSDHTLQIMEQFGITDGSTKALAQASSATVVAGADEYTPDTQPISRKPHLRLGLIFLAVSTGAGLLSFGIFGKNNQLPMPEPQASATKTDPLQEENNALKKQLATANQKNVFASPSPTPTQSPFVAASPPDEKKSPNTSTPSDNTKKVQPKVKTTKPAISDATPQSTPVQPTAYRQPTIAPAAPRQLPDPAQARQINAQQSQIQAMQKKINQLLAQAPKKSDSEKVAKAPPKKNIQPAIIASEVPRQPIPPAIEQPIAPPSPTLMVGSRVDGILIDPINASASVNGSTATNSVQPITIKLSQSILDSAGGKIPAGAIAAFDTTIDPGNGFVTGKSTGVWYQGQALQVPPGALSLQGANGSALQAKIINSNSGDIAAAQNGQAVWGAIGGGVDQMTRQDSTTTIGNGVSIATNTGGDRNFLLGAVGGFARSKVDSEQANAKEKAAKSASMTPIWNLPPGTQVTIAVMPPQTSQIQEIPTSNVVQPSYTQQRNEPLPSAFPAIQPQPMRQTLPYQLRQPATYPYGYPANVPAPISNSN
jgi:hypothetical protein